MTPTATITDEHAAGMSPDKTRLGGVLDTLTAPAVHVDEQIVQLPVDLVWEHPRNPKGRTSDVADITAGLKAGMPINQPIVVATTEAYNAGRLDGDRELPVGQWVIVGGGHRRRAAVIAADLDTIPAIVRDHLADAKGRKTALLENLHRRQLDAFEEADAFFELRDSYKVTQTDLASTVGCDQSHISKRLKLRKLPSTVRAAVAMKTLSIEGALEFAKVCDQGPIFEAAWASFSNNRWEPKNAVRRAIEAHERKVKVEKLAAELAEAGVSVVDQYPSYYLAGRKQAVHLKNTGLNADKHAAEPCHAAHIQNAEATLVCIEPGRHLPDGPSKIKLAKARREEMQGRSNGSSDADKAKRRLLKQCRDIRMDRRDYVARLLSGDLHARLLDGDIEDLDMLALRVFIDGLHPKEEIAMPLLGKPISESDRGFYWSSDVEKMLDTHPPEIVRIATAIGAMEEAMTSTYCAWGPLERTYLMLLARLGRPMLDPEHERLEDTRDKAGNWQPKEDPVGLDNDVRRCRICGCSDARACEDGCHWVDLELCSTCADAAVAGLIVDEPLTSVG